MYWYITHYKVEKKHYIFQTSTDCIGFIIYSLFNYKILTCRPKLTGFNNLFYLIYDLKFFISSFSNHFFLNIYVYGSQAFKFRLYVCLFPPSIV